MTRIILCIAITVCALLSGCAQAEPQSESSMPEVLSESVASLSSASSSNVEIMQSVSSSVEVSQSKPVEQKPEVEKDFCIYPDISEVYPYTVSETRIGTDEELTVFNSLFKGIDAEDIIVFAAEYVPSDYMGIYPLEFKDVDALLAMLKEIELIALPPGTQIGNPATGGGTAYYIETSDIKIQLGFLGWDTVTYPDTGLTLHFQMNGYNGPEPGPSEYLYQKQQGNDVVVG